MSQWALVDNNGGLIRNVEANPENPSPEGWRWRYKEIWPNLPKAVPPRVVFSHGTASGLVKHNWSPTNVSVTITGADPKDVEIVAKRFRQEFGIEELVLNPFLPVPEAWRLLMASLSGAARQLIRR